MAWKDDSEAIQVVMQINVFIIRAIVNIGFLRKRWFRYKALPSMGAWYHYIINNQHACLI